MAAYGQIKVGSPFEEGVLCGPLLNQASVKSFEGAVQTATQHGGKVLFGGQIIEELPGNYVTPTIIGVERDNPACLQEVFVPIVYAIRCSSLEDAISVNNCVAQGLSSSLFTESLENVFNWSGYRLIRVRPARLTLPVDQRDQTAASSMSTSPPMGPRSAEHLAAKRRPAEDVNPAATRGSSTFAAPPGTHGMASLTIVAPSTIARACHWHRASNSSSGPHAHVA